MGPFFVRIELELLSRQLTHRLGCPVSVDDAAELLRRCGFRESDDGWMGRDLRPLMLALGSRRGALGGF